MFTGVAQSSSETTRKRSGSRRSRSVCVRLELQSCRKIVQDVSDGDAFGFASIKVPKETFGILPFSNCTSSRKAAPNPINQSGLIALSF